MTQRDWVVTQLNQTGQISRNKCLNHFISRLANIIQRLETEGYEFTTHFEKNIKPDGTWGQDYVYKVKRFPGQKLPEDKLI